MPLLWEEERSSDVREEPAKTPEEAIEKACKKLAEYKAILDDANNHELPPSTQASWTSFASCSRTWISSTKQ